VATLKEKAAFSRRLSCSCSVAFHGVPDSLGKPLSRWGLLRCLVLGFGNNDLAAARLHIRLGLHGRSPSVNFVMPSIPAPFALSSLLPFVQRPKWMTYPAFLFVLVFMAPPLAFESCKGRAKGREDWQMRGSAVKVIENKRPATPAPEHGHVGTRLSLTQRLTDVHRTVNEGHVTP
jgi:hypothetical protein